MPSATSFDYIVEDGFVLFRGEGCCESTDSQPPTSAHSYFVKPNQLQQNAFNKIFQHNSFEKIRKKGNADYSISTGKLVSH